MARTQPPAQPLSLQGDLDLFSVQTQWEGFRDRLLGHHGPLAVDLAGLGDLDLSGLQLLLALHHHASAKGFPLVFSGVRDEWIERFRPLGLAGFLEGRP